MIYKIVFVKQAVKHLKKIDKPIARRIKRKIDTDLLKNPYINPVLVNNNDEIRRHRVGNYRVLYKINETETETEESVVLVISIKHRKDAYKTI